MRGAQNYRRAASAAASSMRFWSSGSGEQHERQELLPARDVAHEPFEQPEQPPAACSLMRERMTRITPINTSAIMKMSTADMSAPP
jgi:hypothetical protein